MKKQKGAALVVVLSLLTMSLMLGLSGMQSSLVDERLAGNYRAISIAQMGAEQGASQAWKTLWDDEWDGFSVMPDVLGFFGPEALPENFSTQLNDDPWAAVGDLDGHFGGEGACGNLQTCYRYKYILVENDDIEGLPGGLYVVSVGAYGDGGDFVSFPVFVDVSAGVAPFSDLMPITIVSRIFNFNAGSSNQFTVERHGEGNVGPAIAVSDQSDVQAVIDSIEGNPDRSGNYVPDQRDETDEYVVKKDDFSIFSDPRDLQEFVGRIKGLSGVDETLGQAGDPKITYIDGDYDIRDGGGEGEGILIVDGDFTWGGENNYKGLIIVLGQSFTYNGGGGGQIRGAFLHASVSDTSAEEWEFGIANAETGADLSFQGGGNSAFLHDPEVLNDAAGLLPSSVTQGLVEYTALNLASRPSISQWHAN